MSEDLSEVQPEADEGDAAEQRLGLLEDDEPPAQVPPEKEVNPADAAEQHRAVPQDEDDYR
jgi:hypothetical protein